MAQPLEAERVILRPWRDEDVEPWVRMCGNPEVMRFFPRTETPAQARAGAARLRERLERDGYGWWVLAVKGGAAFAGVIALQEVPYAAPFTPATEIGWRLVRSVWGHGYATEGARRALDFAFDELGRDEIVAMTAAINLPSQRVMARLGMTHDPHDDFYHPRLQPEDPLSHHVLYRKQRGLTR